MRNRNLELSLSIVKSDAEQGEFLTGDVVLDEIPPKEETMYDFSKEYNKNSK